MANVNIGCIPGIRSHLKTNAATSADLVFTRSRSRAGSDTYHVTVNLSEALCRRLHWVCGDRVTFDVDACTGFVTLRRVRAGEIVPSWKLGGGNDGDTKKCRFKISMSPIMLKALGLSRSLTPEQPAYEPKITSGERGVVYAMDVVYTVAGGDPELPCDRAGGVCNPASGAS